MPTKGKTAVGKASVKSVKSVKRKRKAGGSAGRPKTGWGGARPGAGRPLGSGPGPSADARRNRVAIMLSDQELARLERIARRRKLPLATLAHALLRRALLQAR
jgi:hypothetical protein